MESLTELAKILLEKAQKEIKKLEAHKTEINAQISALEVHKA